MNYRSKEVFQSLSAWTDEGIHASDLEPKIIVVDAPLVGLTRHGEILIQLPFQSVSLSMGLKLKMCLKMNLIWQQQKGLKN